MALYRMTDDQLDPVPTTTFAAEAVLERADLQRLLAAQIGVILPRLPGTAPDDAPDLPGGLVLSQEYREWDASKRRIDLLCLDADANLVVIEIKRDEGGGHMDLQAIRYAALVHRMTFAQAVRAYARDQKLPAVEAEQAVLDFLGWEEPDESEFGQQTRIVLVAADFSRELATSVLFLNERASLHITCVRVRPHRLGDELVLDVQRVIPPEEAGDYLIRIKEKARASLHPHDGVAPDDPTSGGGGHVPTIPTAAGKGVWFVNLGDHKTVFRDWQDHRRYGYLQAGGGRRWSDQIKRVPEGAVVLAYASGSCYVGVGHVVGPPSLISEFTPPPPPTPPEGDDTAEALLVPGVDAGGTRSLTKWGPLHADLPRWPAGTRLLDLELVGPPNPDTVEDPEKGDWCIPIRWLATRDRDDGVKDDARRPTACELHQPALVYRVIEGIGLDIEAVLGVPGPNATDSSVDSDEGAAAADNEG